MSIKKQIKNIVLDYNGFKTHKTYVKLFKNKQVKLYNWFTFSPDEWLPRFIYERKLLDANQELAIFSVFGRRNNIRKDKTKLKIFYTGENVHSRFKDYEDLLLNEPGILLSLGFDYLNHEKYMRFPIWLMNLFEPNETYQSIKNKCDQLNKNKYIENKTKFCSFLSRHDYFGDREYFHNEILSIGKIDCDGIFKNNNNELKEIYQDNKFEYLKNYKFNLCPENSDCPGYCTEKIFESFKSGCIPIYWGADGRPEPEIINSHSFLYLNKTNNHAVCNEIKYLLNNQKAYLDFVSQNVLLESAPDVIYNYFQNLENRLRIIASC